MNQAPVFIYRKHIDYDPELERSVLGVCSLHAHAFGGVYSMLSEECFYLEEHKEVYRTMEYLFEHGEPVDLLTISRRLYSEGKVEMKGMNTAAFLTSLSRFVASDAHMQHWCLLLRELAAKRLMISFKNSQYDDSADVLDAAEQIQEQLRSALQVRMVNDWMDASTAALRFSDHIDEMSSSGGVVGVSTTFESVDVQNGGLRAGQLVVIGARPSVGKSALMGNIAVQAAKKGKRVGIISLEMPAHDIFGRMVSSEGDVPFREMDQGLVDDDLMRKHIYDSMGRLAGLPLYFSDADSMTIHDIRARAEALHRQHGMDMLIVDYLQLIDEPQGARSREQSIAQISRGLKMLAMNMQIPVIALSQLNRESEHRQNKHPTMADLRESGAIEQDADIIMLLHRDWRVNKYEDDQGNSTEDQADLFIPKWRNGSTMNIKLHFDAATMRFTERDSKGWE